ncbi:MAG TPA: cyclic nucleotide-binding domain-containing protein [Thermoanaerobaculia bacterium]
MTDQLLETLAPHQIAATYPPGAILFAEGAPPAGVHVLLSGAVDLHFAGRNSDRPLRVAERGTILGLSSMMGGRPHEYTAAAAKPVRTGFLDTATFFRVLNEQPALWLDVLRILSRDISSCYDRVRELSAGRTKIEACTTSSPGASPST